MNRTKKFFVNSVSTAILQIVTMLVGFITPRIMIEIYGSEINGLVSSILQFISYFNLVEAGLSSAAIYALYKPLANKDNNGVNAIISAAKKFYNKTGIIFTLLVVILAIIYPLTIMGQNISTIEISMLVLVLGISGVLEFFTLAKYRVLLTADQKTYMISIATIVHLIINTIIIVALANINVNIVILRAIALTSIFIRTIILYVYCRKKYKFIDYTVKPNKNALNKRWDALILQILSTINAGAPIVILTFILKDMKLISVYSIFNMVMVGINGVLGIFVSGLSASFGEIIAKKETETLKKSYSEFEYIYYILITIVYSISFMVIMPFINIYTEGITDINYNMPILGFLFVLNGLMYSIKTPQGMLVISAGMYKETKVQTTIQAVIAVGLGIILTYFFGIYGVLIGSIIANIYRNIDLMIFVPKNITKTKISLSLYRIIRIIGITVLSISLISIIKYSVSDIVSLIIYIVIVSIIVLSITLATNFIFEKNEFKNIINRSKILLKK